MCMLGFSSAVKGKIVSNYLDNDDAMHRVLFNQTILPRIHNLQHTFFNLLFCVCEPLGNLRKIEKCQTNYFVSLLPSPKSKVNAYSDPSAKKLGFFSNKLLCLKSTFKAV